MKRLLPVCVMILCLICSGFTAAETENTATYLPGTWYCELDENGGTFGISMTFNNQGTVPCLTDSKEYGKMVAEVRQTCPEQREKHRIPESIT